ncbi:MAG: hypothetical protein HYR97_07770 [Candidatus Melainabacteria bacterium]|nr:hypothetical protein [Candidatus Melainabacteria bacterium]MBI3309353.1 hypothetical protein [Candidatus Melainabacteria bacterium]
MTTAIAQKKLVLHGIPGDFNYNHYQQDVITKKKYQLAKVTPTELSRLEEITFAEIMKVEFLPDDVPFEEEKPKVKADLPLGSEFSKIDPRWLLFHRMALKKLQY